MAAGTVAGTVGQWEEDMDILSKVMVEAMAEATVVATAAGTPSTVSSSRHTVTVSRLLMVPPTPLLTGQCITGSRSTLAELSLIEVMNPSNAR